MAAGKSCAEASERLVGEVGGVWSSSVPGTAITIGPWVGPEVIPCDTPAIPPVDGAESVESRDILIDVSGYWEASDSTTVVSGRER